MLTVHHLEASRSHRILWLLEELGCPYTLQIHRRDPKTLLAPPSLQALHPLGKAPLVVDEDGTVLAESGAILETLAERHGPHLLPPRGTAAARRCRYWLHFAEGSAMPLQVMGLVFRRVASAPMPFFARPIARAIAGKVQQGYLAPQMAAQRSLMEAELAEGPWFAGADFSLADLQMDYVVEALAAQPGGLDGHPRLARWLAAVQARPAYQRAVARGGPVLLGQR